MAASSTALLFEHINAFSEEHSASAGRNKLNANESRIQEDVRLVLEDILKDVVENEETRIVSDDSGIQSDSEDSDDAMENPEEPVQPEVPVADREYPVEAVTYVYCNLAGKVLFGTKWSGYDAFGRRWKPTLEPLESFGSIEHPAIETFLSDRDNRMDYNVAIQESTRIIEQRQLQENSEDPEVDDSESDEEVGPDENGRWKVLAVYEVACDGNGTIMFHTKWRGKLYKDKDTWEPLELFNDGVQNPAIQDFLSDDANKRIFKKEMKKSKKILRFDSAPENAGKPKYEFEKVANVRREVGGPIEFEVDWKGDYDNTWEPLSSFGGLKLENEGILKFLEKRNNWNKYQKLRNGTTPAQFQRVTMRYRNEKFQPRVINSRERQAPLKDD